MQSLESRVLMSASLVKNINTTLTDANPQDFVASNTEVYFMIQPTNGSPQLWQTNGTAAGTMPATSLVPGAPQATMSDFTNVNGTVYFFAQGPSDGSLIGLWKSNGTVAGTSEIARLAQPSNLISGNGMLYFGAFDGPDYSTYELWKSDGTSAGTAPLTAIPESSFLADADGTFYFIDGTTLWKSDGTAAGTGAVASVANPTGTVNIESLVTVGTRVYVSDSGQLWTSDGNAAGTQMLDNPWANGVSQMIDYDGELYFGGGFYDYNGLWKTDGTSAGTVLVKNTFNESDIEPGPFVIANGTLYFAADDTAHGLELWRSDGTTAGTNLVDDINPGMASGFSFAQPGVPYDTSGYSGHLVAFNGNVYFAATDGIHGVQLWRSDGTAADTSEVYQFTSTDNDSDPSQGITIGNTTYFSADDGIHGYELWKTDGTTTGTVMVADLTPGPGSSYPITFFDFNGKLYFTAAGDLWTSDGTAAGTVIVHQGGYPGDLTQVGNWLYFLAADSSQNYDLFRTDGTAAGTVMIATLIDWSPAPDGPQVGMAVLNGSLYLMVGAVLSRVNADGTITSIESFAGPPFGGGDIISFNGELYFGADNPSTDGQMALWKSDGTAAGTSMVASSSAFGNSPYGFAQMYAVGNLLYFVIWQYDQGETLFRSDGTAAGTFELAAGGYFYDLTGAGGKLYFTLNPSGQSNQVLYTTDGTVAGTKLVDPALEYVGSLMAVNNSLYFTGEESSGSQLFQTDGTTTTLVDPTETSAGWAAESFVAQNNNAVLFVGSDPQNGAELWSVPVTPSAAASFVETDSTTSGKWSGTYGGDGYEIVGGSTSLPSYVTVSVSGNQFWQWAAPGQADYVAPQVSPGSSQYVAACDFAESSFSVNLNFTDGQSHQVALYLLDYDYQGRTETVQVSNAGSGQVLDTRTVTSFQTGKYLVYNLSGDVTITFTNARPQNAVLSGILFGGAPTASATASFAGVDSATRGNWTGVYGSQGYDVIDGSSSLPATVDYTINGEQLYEWEFSFNDPRDLQTSPNSTSVVAACAYSNSSSFTISLDFLDNQAHQVSFYLLDYDARNRAETIQITNAVTGAVLSTETFSNFTQGEYVRWDLSGDVNITFSNAGGLNEVVSGFFIDPVPSPASATFVKTDSTTTGTWTGTYGTNGYDVFNASSFLPSYAALTIPPSVQNYTWSDSTDQVLALQDSPRSSDRIAACDYSNDPSFSFNLDLTDGQTHQVALYFLDYDDRDRSETVQISNALTGQVLDTESVSNFTSGKYLAWDLSGDVNITITNAGGLNEVLSGIFFG